MKIHLLKIFNFLVIFSILLQPLGLVSPVLAETVEMKYDNSHPLHAPEVVDGTAYEYDANGNLTYDGERTIEWNQDNKPIRIERDGEVVEFFYDASGRRVVKRSGEDKTVYINDYYQQSTINNQQLSIYRPGTRPRIRSLQLQRPSLQPDHWCFYLRRSCSGTQSLRLCQGQPA